MGFSVGIGLTNECDLRCPHCYRPDRVVQRLTLRQVQQVCESIPTHSVNLGVGENGLHREYRAILTYLGERGIKTSITSNGFSIHTLPDDVVKRFHSVEFSLDFPTEQEHDAFRGTGNWKTVMSALARCVELGVAVTVTAVMMSVNHDKLTELARVAAAFDANLRINVYQPSRTDHFTLTYEQFWTAFRRLARATRLVATSEPVLAGVLGLSDFAGPG
jgi:MoaA/NifB/PqqE/SkfB family radical SAM enzyme